MLASGSVAQLSDLLSVLGRRIQTASSLLSLPEQARKAQPPAQVPQEPGRRVIPVPELEREAPG